MIYRKAMCIKCELKVIIALSKLFSDVSGYAQIFIALLCAQRAKEGLSLASCRLKAQAGIRESWITAEFSAFTVQLCGGSICRAKTRDNIYITLQQLHPRSLQQMRAGRLATAHDDVTAANHFFADRMLIVPLGQAKLSRARGAPDVVPQFRCRQSESRAEPATLS